MLALTAGISECAFNPDAPQCQESFLEVIASYAWFFVAAFLLLMVIILMWYTLRHSPKWWEKFYALALLVWLPFGITQGYVSYLLLARKDIDYVPVLSGGVWRWMEQITYSEVYILYSWLLFWILTPIFLVLLYLTRTRFIDRQFIKIVSTVSMIIFLFIFVWGIFTVITKIFA